MQAHKYAEQLRNAYNSRTAIDPLRNLIGITDLNLAYEIQQVNTDFRLNQGARIVGKKIGLTSLVVQQQLGVDQPDFGILFHDMEVLNGLSVSMSQLMQPKAEAEIAFVLAEDLDQEDLTIVDVMAAIDYCLPAIEIVGSRIKNWDIKITDTIADNASASHFVVGHTPKTLDEFDLVKTQMQLHKNKVLFSSGQGSNCLGSPLNALLWLANTMRDVDQPLQAGELIFSGACGPMAEVTAGDLIEVSFEGLGHVSVSFTD